ncbi:MAG: NAD(P)-binding domain-containing protein, partial [Acidimicrobiales bacterium]
MKVVVVGAGAVGARAARQLVSSGEVGEMVVVERDPRRGVLVAEALGRVARSSRWSPRLVEGADVVLLAAPSTL